MENYLTDKCFKLLDHVKAKNGATKQKQVNQDEPDHHEDNFVEDDFYPEENEPIGAIFTQTKN